MCVCVCGTVTKRHATHWFYCLFPLLVFHFFPFSRFLYSEFFVTPLRNPCFVITLISWIRGEWAHEQRSITPTNHCYSHAHTSHKLALPVLPPLSRLPTSSGPSLFGVSIA